MSNITAKIDGQLQTWVSAGTSDTVICTIYPGEGQKGIQIETPGYDLASATITVYSKNGAAKAVTAPAGSEYIVVGTEGFLLSKIVVTGVAAGTRTIAFSAI